MAVPLRNGGFAAGRIARVAARGGVCSYFFGPRYEKLPLAKDLEDKGPTEAILVCIHGDLGLRKGTWRVLASGGGWQPDRWPVPHFGRREELTERKLRVRYSEKDLLTPLSEEEMCAEGFAKLPTDGVFGAAGSSATATSPSS